MTEAEQRRHFQAAFLTARDAKGLKNYEIAKVLEVAQSTIGKYARGALPRGDHLIKLARLFGMAPEELVPVSGKPHPDTREKVDRYVIGGRRALDEMEGLLLKLLKEMKTRWHHQDERARVVADDAMYQRRQTAPKRRTKGL